MKLIKLLENQQHIYRAIDLVEKDQLSLGMSNYDVDMDIDGDRVYLQVLQNGMQVGELTYEDGEVVWIHVEPFFRKQGLGRAMIEYLQDNGYSVVLPDARTDDGKEFFGRLDQKGELDEVSITGDFDDDFQIDQPRKRKTPLLREDEGPFDWSKPTTFYRGVVDPNHAEEPFSGTRRGVPTFTDDWAVASTYAQSPNDIQRDKGKRDQVYAYRLNIQNPIKLFDNTREDVTEANYILRQLGATTVGEAWKLFQGLFRDIGSWRSDGETFYADVDFPVEIEGWGDNPTNAYENLNQVFVDHWEHDWPALYCTSYDLADSPRFQNLVKKAGYDGMIYYGHTTVEWHGITDDDILTGTSFDGITAMEWRALDSSQVEFLGPAPTRPMVSESYSDRDIEQRREQMRQEPVKPGMYMMYRACPEQAMSFQPMDYVTLNKKFAVEHAQHMTVTEDEPHHVIKRMVDQKPGKEVLFHAPNPGEFFYDGPELESRRPIKVSTNLDENVVALDSGYTEQFYDTMEQLHSRGKPVSNLKAVSPDAWDVLDDHEHDLDWRITEVPLSAFPKMDFDHEYPEEYERKMEFLRSNPRTHLLNPLLIGLDYESGLIPLYDGHHRVAVARELGIQKLPALIGRPPEDLNETRKPGNALYYMKMQKAFSKEGKFHYALLDANGTIVKEVISDPEMMKTAGEKANMREISMDEWRGLKGRIDRVMEARKPWLRITPEMIRQAKGNKCQVIVEMPAEDFLLMTTSSKEQQEQIKQASRKLRDYNKWAKAGSDNEFRNRLNFGKTRDDDDYAWGTIIMPFLMIDIFGNNGRIKGHEGRHRAAAALREGNGMVQVALCMNPSRDHPAFVDSTVYDPRYAVTSEHIPPYIKGQFDGQMYSTDNWKIAQDDMQKNVR